MKTTNEMKGFAAQMRRVKTPAEQTAYNILKDNFLATGAGFKNQVVFGYYILDFVVPSKMLVIELDGSSHEGREAYDARRDAFVKECGLTTIRLHNDNAALVAAELAAAPFVMNWMNTWERAKKVAAKAKKTGQDVAKISSQTSTKTGEESYLHLARQPRKPKKRREISMAEAYARQLAKKGKRFEQIAAAIKATGKPTGIKEARKNWVEKRSAAKAEALARLKS
ncbi:endonuclease domain-containing protein [Hymenobacter latericus]|uniref:endonuclease domain-containing protein n=1 Tax=Hymenobacter sp. YIM 151858-1 TaxID=2987688 RepID=UPI002225EBFD|nr:DUF559 domain-containing protein [Hymenobacter sp. YIM 151858-1]UYZ60115.1 DUF559 domain-containing protein [Hymenobacter sp. YIM 151858-1]